MQAYDPSTLGQEDCRVFVASLGSIESSRPAWTTDLARSCLLNKRGSCVCCVHLNNVMEMLGLQADSRRVPLEVREGLVTER